MIKAKGNDGRFIRIPTLSHFHVILPVLRSGLAGYIVIHPLCCEAHHTDKDMETNKLKHIKSPKEGFLLFFKIHNPMLKMKIGSSVPETVSISITRD
jgi:hypothetical protein